MKFSLGSVIIDSSSIAPAIVIAEIGHNHQGNLATALKLVEKAKEAGCHFVKFQKRHNKELYTEEFYNSPYTSPNSYAPTYGLHRDVLEFGRKEYLTVKQYCDEIGIEFLCTAFDKESVDFLEDLGVCGYKIGSGDLTNKILLEYIAQTNKPMIVSTGASWNNEIDGAYSLLCSFGNPFVLMHCVSIYPSPFNKLNLRWIKEMKTRYPKAVIGYSGHETGILVPPLSYVYGARVIEKHFTLDRTMKGTDQQFSLEPEQMRSMIRDLDRTRLALGKGGGIRYCDNAEKDARKKMGKSIYLRKDVQQGAEVTMESLCFKSPQINNSYLPDKIDLLLFQKFSKDLKAKAPLKWGDVEFNPRG